MTFKVSTHSAKLALFYLFIVSLLTACGGGGGASSETIQTLTLETLSLNMVSASLKVDDEIQLVVTGTYSDASTENISSQIAWTIADPAIVSISNTGLVRALSAGETNVTATFAGKSVQLAMSVKALTQLSISPSDLTLAVNSVEQLTVTGIYSDNSVEDVSDSVTWLSANTTIATVSSTGEVRALSAGSTSISANIDGISATLNVLVSPAILESIVISSPLTQIASGLSIQLSAKGIYSDGSEQTISNDVVWSVADNFKASIVSNTGFLNAIRTGNVSVNATRGNVSGTFLLSISAASLDEISISPSRISLAKGTSERINVTAIFSDNTKQDISEQVIWTNTNDLVASLSQRPLTVEALSVGDAIFTASLSGQSATVAVQVTDAELVSLAISPLNSSLPLGLTTQFTAQGVFTDDSVQDLTSEVTWLSDNANAALVSNAGGERGLVSSVALGVSTISAALGSIQQQTTLTIDDARLLSIDIQPAKQTIANGTDAEVTAFGNYSDGSKVDLSAKVIWSASQQGIVELSSISEGVVQTLNEGDVLLSAELDGISGIANVVISSASLQSIEIESEQVTLPNGTSQRLFAIGRYSDATTKDISKQLTWRSSDTSVLTVGNSTNNASNNEPNDAGVVRANGLGQAIVEASLGSVTGQVTLNVSDAVLTSLQITANKTELNQNASAIASAIAEYSDQSTQNVTEQVNWSSSDPSIITIENTRPDKGFIKALSVGNATLSASLHGVDSNDLAINVTLDPNLPKALNLSVQPNIILNDANDSSLISINLVPSGQDGVIADGTAVTLTITEGDSSRDETLFTSNGAVSYLLRSSYDGFISISASSEEFFASSGLLASDEFIDAIAARGLARVLYENDTLRAGSRFVVLIRNLSNREFGIDQVDIFYLDPNNSNNQVDFRESPLTNSEFLSDGDLTGGEFTSIGYQLNNDLEANIYGITYFLTDEATQTRFGLSAGFNFAPNSSQNN